VGMGINSLLNSTMGFMAALTEFGLRTSAVKNVSEANAKGGKEHVAIIITVLRRWVWVTGLLGTLLTLILSPWLSQIAFGNHKYTLAFVWIAVTLLFQQVTGGQMVLLQGLRKLKYLAKASMSGSFIGLAIALPLYYFWGLDGIVPAIIGTSAANMLLTWYFARKVKIEKVKVSRQTTLAEGKEMLIMGFMLSLAGLITLGTSYLVRIYISHKGGVGQVGLYGAGFAIINTYVGLVFTAMGTDYYPRLSAVAKDNHKSRESINQQAEISILILAPILLVFMVFIKLIIIILYSHKFVAVNGMVQWAALGMFFKAASWSIAFIFLAKGAAKLFFWNELITNVYLLGFNLLGYYFYGLTGLGISFLISYFVYLLQVYFVSKIRYNFSFTTEFYKLFVLQLILATTCFLVVKFTAKPYDYIIGSLLILISAYFSYRGLDKRLDIKSLIKNRF